MLYGILSEYDISSLKREVERSLEKISNSGEELDSYRRDVNGRLREVESAVSSLSRAIDERVRELQRNAGKSSGYSSYSSADSNIKSELRKIDGLLDKIKSEERDLDDVRRQIKTASSDVLPRFEKLQSSHKSLSKELGKINIEANDSRKANERASEELKRLSSVERKLRSEIESERKKSFLYGAASLAAIAKCDNDEDDNDRESERVSEVQEEYERKIEELRADYEKKIASLDDAVVREQFEARIKRLSDLLEDKKLELKQRNGECESSREELSQSKVELDAERQKNKTLSDELAREKEAVENYRKILKKRTFAHLLVKSAFIAKRFVAKWYLLLAAGFIAICFIIIFICLC